MTHLCFCGNTFATPELLVQHINKKGHNFQCACARIFARQSAVKDHLCDVVHPPSSGFLQRTAIQKGGSVNTTALTKCSHCYRKAFADNSALEHHFKDKHFPCPQCHQIFFSATQRFGHQKAALHCYCAEHEMASSSPKLHAHHMRAEPHFFSFECVICARSFATETVLNDHLVSPGHAHVEQAAAKAEQEKGASTAARYARERANLKYEACDQSFKTLCGFQQHKSSVKHKPLRELKCPLSDTCMQIFTFPSALLFHLESGGCRSGVNRDQLNTIVYKNDTSRHITRRTDASLFSASIANALRVIHPKSSALSGRVSLHDSDEDLTDSDSVAMIPDDTDLQSVISDFSGVLLSPDDGDFGDGLVDGGAVLLTPSISQISQSIRGWNMVTPSVFTPTSTSVAGSTIADNEPRYNQHPKTWSCTFCERCFRTSNAIMQHMSSVAHGPKVFHCPIDLTGSFGSNKPTIAFKTLSGLAQHIEAGSCKGGMDTLRLVVGLLETGIQTRMGKTVCVAIAQVSIAMHWW